MPDFPKEFTDFLGDFSAGVNAGVAPLLLPKNQLANGMNTTVRGTFVKPRPPFQKLTFDADSQAVLDAALAIGPYQGGCYFEPDNNPEGLMIAIAGYIFQITPSDTDNTAIAISRPVTSGVPPLNPSTQSQAWMWQSEKWVVVNDGVSLPLFVSDSTNVRSSFNSSSTVTTTTTSDFTVPPISATGSVDFTSVAGLSVDDVVTVLNQGQFQVTAIAGLTVSFTNLSMLPQAVTVTSGRTVSWTTQGTQLPVGRQGAYGMGRNWMVLADGKQFVASDLVGGSSGTAAENYRDAVLNITENTYLAGGGYFTVPGRLGSITFMQFTATLDSSLGQGPLQVGTNQSVFSCNAPVDRAIWQDIQNPILTQSLIGNGGLGYYSTINVNGDLIFRSIDGIRSLILARREFNTWGNVPISREIEPLLSLDSPDLLRYGSGIFFDNRMLMTATPVLSDQGIYHLSLVVMNCDPISSLHGKAPAVWDALQWTGLNVLQLFRGEFQGTERALALCLNTRDADNPYIELYEILRSATDQIKDNGTESIVWSFESPVLFGPQVNPKREFLQLWDGEIFVDDLRDTVNFQVWYKPDQYPCWTQWFAWQECANQTTSADKPQFRPQMGLGQPPPGICDESTGRPMNLGFSFQVKLVITGHCRIVGARFKAKGAPEPAFSPQSCNPICSPS